MLCPLVIVSDNNDVQRCCPSHGADDQLIPCATSNGERGLRSASVDCVWCRAHTAHPNGLFRRQAVLKLVLGENLRPSPKG
jgi:hypothetical protein